METAIQITWWIGLIGALVATLIIVYEVALVLRTLGDIYRLAELTRGAARGVAEHVATISRLAALEDPARGVREEAAAVAAAAASVERKLETLEGS